MIRFIKFTGSFDLILMQTSTHAIWRNQNFEINLFWCSKSYLSKYGPHEHYASLLLHIFLLAIYCLSWTIQKENNCGFSIVEFLRQDTRISKIQISHCPVMWIPHTPVYIYIYIFACTFQFALVLSKMFIMMVRCFVRDICRCLGAGFISRHLNQTRSVLTNTLNQQI